MPRLSRALTLVFSLGLLLAFGQPAAAQTGLNGRVVFRRQSQVTGFGVHSINADGTGETTLTSAGDFDPDAARLPRRIVFASSRDSSHAEIYIMNPDGSGQTRLTFDNVTDFNPSLSPDGAKIVFESRPVSNLPPQIYVMNADGSGRTALTTSGFSTEMSHSPQWSPDGKKIVFASNRHQTSHEIYTMNADGSGVVRLSTNTADETTPNWSPDGKKIIYSRIEAAAGGYQLYTMNAADGGNKVRLLLMQGDNTQPDWSPDGTKIVFANKADSPSYPEIYVVNSNGTSPVRLTTNDVNDDSPSWQGVSVPLVISEFRLRGPGGALDEFVEIYNDSDTATTVQALDGSAGYAVAASDGAARFHIPNGTVIPARGHFLGANSAGYSLGSHPGANAGLKPTAAGDATYAADIADNQGLALFDTADPAAFNAGRRLDAVGSAAEANALYREGAGYAPITLFSMEYSFYRDDCGKGGSTTALGPCTRTTPKDTGNNAADFVFVDVNGTNANAGQRLGAPGPQNLSAPVQNGRLPATLVAPCAAASAPPNRARDFTSDPGNNSTYGTLTIRRRFTNNTGAPVTRLRFRVVDISTLPAPSGYADLRARSSSVEVVSPNPCGPGALVLQGTTLEEPPAQAEGGGFNSALSAGVITPATPLAPGASVDVQWRLGLEQTGSFKFLVNVEALP